MLTIQRQFSLPNCVLILEGFNTDGASSPRPPLSTLSRFECHFSNEPKTIQGGRELLNLLAIGVHKQAQSLLSGVQSKAAAEEKSDLTLTPLESGTYRLTIAEPLLQRTQAPTDGKTGSTTDSEKPQTGGSLELTLNSVQLFDLVEAFDQLMEDQQTLPDLTMKLRPLSRKDARSQEATAQKFLPLGLGIASLALVSAVSFVIPIPEVQKPAESTSEEVIEEVIETEALPTDAGGADDTPEENSVEIDDSAEDGIEPEQPADVNE
ncbi:MAG: DUF4335 domain-containing protein [Cyanobacteria bacterium P01_F01_bin.42]